MISIIVLHYVQKESPTEITSRSDYTKHYTSSDIICIELDADYNLLHINVHPKYPLYGRENVSYYTSCREDITNPHPIGNFKARDM